MYSQYKQLSSEKFSQSKFQKFVEDADTDELCKMVLRVLNTSEAIKMLDDILHGFSDLDRCHSKKYKLIKTIFEALKTAKVTGKHVDNIVGRIVADFVSFDRAHLVKLVDYFIERIRNNDDEFTSWKDVIPLLLEKLEEEKSIDHRGSDVSGKEYKVVVIRCVCDIDWDPKILTSIAKMFVEILADIKDKAISEMIMKALTSKLMTIDINELPPLAHQLLKLGSENNSVLLYATLSKYFAQNYASVTEENNSQDTCDSIVADKVTLKEVQEVESTVLYYIYQAALDNSKGSMEYMKCLKLVVNAPQYILDTFVMSVLLLLSGLFDDQAFPILKGAILRQIQEVEYQNNSAWFRKISSNDSSVLDTIYRVIENSNKDRQLVLKGVVDFAFVLLGIERKVGVQKHLPWEYGCKILQKIARKRSDAGGTILEILVDRIVRSGANVIQYTECLTYMCRRLTMTVLEHQVWITTLLEQLLVIPGSAASQVLQAILPLMRVSGSIRDNLIMVLRKALYRKGTHTRQMSVLGFLQLLKNLKLTSLTALSQSESLSSSNVASSSSIFTQATLERPSQKAASNPWHNTSLCREILAILSKCFCHEMEVRSHLYRELYYAIAKNEELTEYVIEMVLEHFSKYYEKDEAVLPPIFFDKCCTCQGIEMVLQEPVADLVFALQKIYVKVASKDSPRIDKLAVVLESLCKRMVQTDLEHMGIDEETDLLDNTPKAQTKLLNIKLAISVYEALMAYKIASWSMESLNPGQSVIGLYKGYWRLVEHIKKLSKGKRPGKGKKDKDKEKDKDGNDTTMRKPGRIPTVKLPHTVMDFDNISKSIILLYNQNNSWATAEQTSSLRGRMEFHQYILNTCLQLFQNVKTMKDHELQSYLELNKHNFLSIGETLYKYVVCDLKTVSSFNESIAESGLECFKECADVMCSLYSSELPAFLEATAGVDSSSSLPQQLPKTISSLKDIFISSLDEETPEDITAQKNPLHLIETISKYVQKVDFNEINVEESFDWLKNIMKEREDIDVQVSVTIIQLLLLIEEQSEEYSDTLQDLCAEFCAVLGKADKSEVTATRKFRMINDANIYPAYIAVNKILTAKLQNVNWLLGRLNAEHSALTSLEVDSESNRKAIKDKEQSLCRQFSFILSIFEILASVKIMPGQASDAIFKNLQKVYNFACALAKYFRKKSTATNPAFQSVKFIPVIQGAGSALKQAITDLILHVESSQSGGKSSDANVQRNKILKEVMVIPGVVQAIDMFDKEIALLAKKTGVDLMKYTKYDSIRDFRIQNSKFMENLEKMNVSLLVTQARTDNQHNQTSQSNHSNQSNEDEVDDDENETSANSGSDSDVSPSKKRRK